MKNTEILELSGHSVEVVRKRIKNLHIGVYPPLGHVRVAAPPHISTDAIRLALVQRLSWIKKKRLEFLNQARETERRYVSGETHFVFGRPLRLQVSPVEGRQYSISTKSGDRLFMSAPKSSTCVSRQRWLEAWYRNELLQRAKPRVENWAGRLGVSYPRIGIRKMRTKWGSCNPDKQIVWLNLDLAKKPLDCLDYVILHEMAHFISRKHDERFLKVLDQQMPAWRQIRSDLNALPLSHVETTSSAIQSLKDDCLDP